MIRISLIGVVCSVSLIVNFVVPNNDEKRSDLASSVNEHRSIGAM